MEIQLERRGQLPMAPESKQASVAPILQEGSASLPAFVVPRLLRIQDAAKYLSATTWQIETLLREKTVPSFVLGKRRVVDRLELDRYVERRNAEAKAALRDKTA
jgi:excisionase family DNA binding protein